MKRSIVAITGLDVLEELAHTNLALGKLKPAVRSAKH